MARWLHVEGVDLSGKSSTISSFTAGSREIWNVQHGRLGEDEDRYHFALGAVGEYPLDLVGDLFATAVEADIATHERPGQDTIQDSLYIVRSLAYFTAVKDRRLMARFEDLLQMHPRFDQSFVLTADLDVRQERLRQRLQESPESVSQIDQLLLHSPDFAASLGSAVVGIAQEAFDATLIDTTNMPLPEVTAFMREVVYDGQPAS